MPDAPENVTISESDARYQIVTWDAPFDGNSLITEYQVFVSSDRDPELVQIYPSRNRLRKRQAPSSSTITVDSITNTSINVSGLIPFVEYQYTVIAENGIGRSVLSELSSGIRTDPAGTVCDVQFIVPGVSEFLSPLSTGLPTYKLYIDGHELHYHQCYMGCP